MSYFNSTGYTQRQQYIKERTILMFACIMRAINNNPRTRFSSGIIQTDWFDSDSRHIVRIEAELTSDDLKEWFNIKNDIKSAANE